MKHNYDDREAWERGRGESSQAYAALSEPTIPEFVTLPTPK